MKVQSVKQSDFEFDGEPCCVVVPVVEGAGAPESTLLDDADMRSISGLIEQGVIKGKKQETYFLPTPSSAYRGVLTVGVGEGDPPDLESVRRAAGKACKSLRRSGVSRVVIDCASVPQFPAVAFTEGIVLGQYRFETYRKPKCGGVRSGARVTTVSSCP